MLTDNNQIFWTWFVIIHCHLTKVSAQIIQCIIFERNELSINHLLYLNQPHLLNKYQINVCFSYFHEFGILSGIQILAPYQIDIVKGCGFCNDNVILI